MIRELPLVLKELDELSSLCSRCGMCQSVCPVFQQTGHESDVARGKLALLDGLMDAVLSDSKSVLTRVNKCLLCGSCASSCSRGVNTLEIFIRARIIIASFAGISPFKKFILRQVICRPRLFHKLAGFAGFLQKFLPKAASSGGGVGREMITPPFAAGRHLVSVSDSSLKSTGAAEREGFREGNGKFPPLKIAFFTGCVMNKIYPDIADLSVGALKQQGAGVFVSEDEVCCGIPALSAGDGEAFRRLVDHNLALYGGGEFDYIVTACATCAFTIRKLWPMMYKSDSPETDEQLKQLALKTVDITEFLVSQKAALGESFENGNGDSEDCATVTYHDPCHLKKSLGVWQEPRTLINASPGYRLVEMAAPDTCCGAGGSFTIEHYDISSGIGSRKLADIHSTGADIVATSCPGCMMQLSDLISRSGSDIKVKHVMEIFCSPLSS